MYMKVKHIQAYLRSLGQDWVDPRVTVDQFIAGDPEAECTGIAVSWMSATWALKQALQVGCNLFITHEPTYFSHHDDDPQMLGLPPVAAKRDWIQESSIVILRCHDVWDQYPGEGITDSWARFLGLGQPIERDGYYRVYDVSGHTSLEIARQVATAIRPLGQEAAQLIGLADKPVTRLALGTGAITPFFRFLETYQADVALCTDDGILYWRDAALAIDLGIPIIVANHIVSEEAGMASLAEHLRAKFHPLPVLHIPQHCPYSLVYSNSK
jgi:putative NIF3 family GTP cyclohydrolase 1 type 2